MRKLRKTKTLKQIERLYQEQSLDVLTIYERSKALLEIYRNVVWSLKNTADSMIYETQETYGKDLDEALIYLSTFAPEFKRQDFESGVSHLFESKWLIEIIDKSLVKIKDYPEFGEIYSAILMRCYLGKTKTKDAACMQMLNLERSCYYQRKREAITLLGVSLWGFELPRIIQELHEENLKAIYYEEIKSTIPIYTTEDLARMVEKKIKPK